MTDEDSRSRTSTGSLAGAVRRRGKSRPGSPRSTASFPKTQAAGLADPGRKVDLTERSVRRGEGRGRGFASLLPKTTFKFFEAPLCCDKP